MGGLAECWRVGSDRSLKEGFRGFGGDWLIVERLWSAHWLRLVVVLLLVSNVVDIMGTVVVMVLMVSILRLIIVIILGVRVGLRVDIIDLLLNVGISLLVDEVVVISVRFSIVSDVNVLPLAEVVFGRALVVTEHLDCG